MIERVENHGAVDQSLTVVENQRRYTNQRVCRPHFVGFLKDLKRPVFVWNSVVAQCHSAAPDERGEIAADQNHDLLPAVSVREGRPRVPATLEHSLSTRTPCSRKR